MAGILSGIKLREAGFSKITLYEKADRVGGTWRENTYPGLTCDVDSHSYTYTFEPNPEWSHRFPPGDEIQAYFEASTTKFGVDEMIRFNEEIVRCEHVEGRWRLEMKSGLRDEADIVIAATGVLHHPSMPEIEGLDDFEGASFHSARWDHDVPLDGQRVGIIGNGSTGVQIVSALASRAGALYHFQRTAQWIMASENPAYSEKEKAAFRADPDLMRNIKHAFDSGEGVAAFSEALTNADSPMMLEIEATVKANLEESVQDPELRERLRPDYRAACKRMIFSPDYYEAIQHENADLVTDPIARVEAKGVRLESGRLIELDVLALATGFKADRFMRPMELIGRAGVKLEEVWAKRPAAYLSISIPDFPNFFMLNGPNGPVGNFSLIDIAERQMAYISQLIDLVAEGRCSEVSASSEAMAQFDEERIGAAKNTIWASGCKSWYLDSEGIPASWPFSQKRFHDEMGQPRLEDYQLIA
ncbi:MAG: NAD(P)/FAD-dependent oxidoreductase [bacterium]|nr:monooxygenase [Deltaproteobacteria bacterium]MCP4908861.1 NAD(P)/FAD-dependent oxidoreductase [bacterium]